MKLVNNNGVFSPVVRKAQSPQKPVNIVLRQPTTEVAKLDAALKGELNLAIKRSRGGLGDMVFVTPLTRALKRKYPRCLVTVITDYSYSNGELVDLLRHNPYIDFVAPHDQYEDDSYNAVFEVTGPELRFEQAHTSFPTRTEIWARLIGLPLEDGRGIYVPTTEEISWAKKYLKSVSSKNKFIGVQIRSNDPKRTWPMENLLEMITYVNSIRNDVTWILMDSEQHKVQMRNVHNMFGYSIRALAAIINEVDLFLGPDSALTHIAGALNKKTVALFGAIPPEARIKHNPNTVAVRYDKLACLGCVYSACIHPTHKCMEMLTYREIWPIISGRLEASLIPLTLETYQDGVGPMIIQPNRAQLHGDRVRIVEI